MRRFRRFSYLDLLPFAALVRVELLRTLRLTRSIVFVGLFLVVASVVALFNWPTEASSWSGTGSAARAFLLGTSLVLWIGTALSIPAIAGNSVVQERERRTLDMLATTYATPALFVLAKLINSVGFAAILCISMAPILVLPVFLVGVDLWTPFAAVLLVLAMSLATASLGIWSSLRCRRSATAVACSYGLMLVLQGAPAVLLVMLLDLLDLANNIMPVSQAQYTINVLVPYTSLAQLILGPALAFRIHPFHTATILQLSIAVAGVYFSVRRARKLWGGSQSVVEVPQGSSRRGKSVAHSGTFRRGFNPVMLKELRFTLGLTGRNGIWIVSCTFLTCVSATVILLHMKATNDLDEFLPATEAWMVLRATAMPFIAVLFCVPLVHNERIYRNLDALRSTLLTPTEVLRGKLLAMCAVCCVLVFAAFAGDLPHLLYRFDAGHEGIMLLTGAGTLLTCMLLAIGTSVAAAVFLKDRNTALAVSMVALFCLLIGNYWLIVEAIGPLFGYHSYIPHRMVPHGRVHLSPIMALLNQADSVRYNSTHFTNWTTTMLLYASISSALIATSFRGFGKRMS